MTFLLAFLAGLLSILSPCVLPLVPVVLAGAVQQNKMAPLALMGGLVVTFTATGMLFAAFGFGAGLDKETTKVIAGVIMIFAAIFILVAQVQERFTLLAEPLFDRLRNFIARFNAQGLGGQAALGALLGVVWSPCAGPTLGAAVGLAMQKESMAGASFVMFAFAVGAVTPLLVLAYAGSYAIFKRKSLSGFARFAKPALGVFLLLIGASIVTGADKTVEGFLTKLMPAWVVDLTTRF
ncbi:MAG: cytochrome c biogenesis protein CcdA [Nitrospinae bacterium]|nr:cytochrome c biogenesis protein CcdA [Nitrospinota bacterium]